MTSEELRKLLGQLVMAPARRSPHPFWVPLATIVGAMLAAADASAYDTTSNDRSTVACSSTRADSTVRSDSTAVHDQDWLVTVDQPAGPAAVQDSSKTNDGPCVCSSQSLDNPACRTGHRVPKRHLRRTVTTVRVVFDSGARLTRLHGGSKRHRGDCAPAYFVTMPADDPNDDTTSDDPDDDDDNDTSKFLNGYDDTDVLIIACLQEKMPNLIAGERTLATRAAPPSATFLILQRLRC